MTAKAPRAKPAPPATPPDQNRAAGGDVVPISKGRESRDFSQRALDVVRKATERDDEDADA